MNLFTIMTRLNEGNRNPEYNSSFIPGHTQFIYTIKYGWDGPLPQRTPPYDPHRSTLPKFPPGFQSNR